MFCHIVQADGQGKQLDEIGETENLTLSLGDKPGVHLHLFYLWWT